MSHELCFYTPVFNTSGKLDGCLSRTLPPSTKFISVPRFSVLVCTYQRAQLLPRAISSVLQQSFADFELIVVDDGSSDGAKEVVESFQDERILFLANSENRGLARSTNRGFAEAAGDFLSILDDDDEFEPTFLPHVLVNVYRQPERLTLHNTRRAKSLEYIIDKHAPFLSTHSRLKSALYFQLGTVLADAGERLWVRRALGAYLRESPKDVAAWRIWLSSELRHYWFGLKLLQVYRWFYHRYFAPQA